MEVRGTASRIPQGVSAERQCHNGLEHGTMTATDVHTELTACPQTGLRAYFSPNNSFQDLTHEADVITLTPILKKLENSKSVISPMSHNY